jgi:diguanylate cyclase (GGDEF)-like protein
LPLSLLYIDVDRFKAINDAQGHAVGDRVLRHVAKYIRHKFREADYVFRIGGDEFVVLISCGADEAGKRVRDLQGGFHATLVEADLPPSLGLSVGLTQVATDANGLEQAMALADERMYADKRRRATSALGE